MANEKRLREGLMSHDERLNAVLRGQKPDRVPFIQISYRGFSARNVGFDIYDAYTDGEKAFFAQFWSQEQYGLDGFPMWRYASQGAWEFGGEIQFPTGEHRQAPTITKHPVETEEDVWNLKVPDVKALGSTKIAMTFSEAAKKAGVPIITYTFSPFTIAGNICGVEKLCRWMKKKPEVAKRLLELAVEYILAVTKLWVDTFGVEIWAFTGDPSSANQIISPKDFEKFALPYNIMTHEKILAMGIKNILCHICGEQNLNLPYWAETPFGKPGVVSFGHEVDIDTAIKYFGNRCVIAGNVEPAFLLLNSPQRVYDLCKTAIEKGKKAPLGFILMPGCEFAINTPPYNLYTVMKCVNDFGWYD